MSGKHNIRNLPFCQRCNRRYASFYKMCIKLSMPRCKFIYTEIPRDHNWHYKDGKPRYLQGSRIDPTVDRAFYLIYSRREHLFRYGHGIFTVKLIKRLNAEKTNEAGKRDRPHFFDRFILVLRYNSRFVQFLPHVGMQFKLWLKKPSNSAVGYINRHKDYYHAEWYYSKMNKFFRHDNCQEDVLEFLQWYKIRYPYYASMFDVLSTNEVVGINDRLMHMDGYPNDTIPALDEIKLKPFSELIEPRDAKSG